MSRMRVVAAGFLLLAAVGCSSTKAGQGAIGPTDCSGRAAVQPSGAPYCYLAPAGFARQSDAPTDLKWEAVLKLGSGNAISSGVASTDQSIDKLSDSQLLNVTNRGAQNMGNGIVLQSTNGVLTKIPAGRSIVYHGSLTENGTKVGLDLYFVYHADVQFNLNCYWTTAPDKVKQACSQALLTLRIKATAQ